jgi:hypothetical protein
MKAASSSKAKTAVYRKLSRQKEEKSSNESSVWQRENIIKASGAASKWQIQRHRGGRRQKAKIIARHRARAHRALT